MALAYAMEHRRTLRLLSVMSLLGAVGLLAVLLFFALDVVQLRNTVPAERLPSFQAGALIAELKHLTSFVALALLGIGGWKTAAPKEAGDSKLSNELNIVMKQGAKTGR